MPCSDCFNCADAHEPKTRLCLQLRRGSWLAALLQHSPRRMQGLLLLERVDDAPIPATYLLQRRSTERRRRRACAAGLLHGRKLVSSRIEVRGQRIGKAKVTMMSAWVQMECRRCREWCRQSGTICCALSPLQRTLRIAGLWMPLQRRVSTCVAQKQRKYTTLACTCQYGIDAKIFIG